VTRRPPRGATATPNIGGTAARGAMSRATIVRGTPPYRAVQALGVAAVGVAALVLPFTVSDFRLGQWTLAVGYALAVVGLNLLTGFGGQISLAQGAFFGLGAYTAAVTVALHGWPFLLSVPLAAGLCFVTGLAIGLPALRLRGFYLALITLGVAVLFPRFVSRFESVTGGVGGIIVPADLIAAPRWTGLSLEQFLWFVAVGVAVPAFWLAHRLVRSPFGTALVALRDQEIPAITLGFHAAHHKALAFAVSAAYAGVGGTLFMFHTRLASPQQFGFTVSLDLLAAAVVGGLVSVSGALAGGVVVQFFPLVALWFQQRGFGFAGVAYGVILVLCMMVMPTGFVGLLRTLRDLVVRVEPAPMVPEEDALAGGGEAEAAEKPLLVPAGPSAAHGPARADPRRARDALFLEPRRPPDEPPP
jgi:branched-chain amino acid transport system permease protein